MVYSDAPRFALTHFTMTAPEPSAADSGHSPLYLKLLAETAKIGWTELERFFARGMLLRADFNWPKADRRNEFLRAKLNAQGGLDLFPNQGSAVLTSTVWGDGLDDNPPGKPIAAGELVRIIPFSELMY